jgi:FkbM family methyltransferase
LKDLIFRLVNWYVKKFQLPHRGLKYFIRLLKLTGDYNKTYVKRIHNGFVIRVNPTDHIQRQVFWYGYYEKKCILTWESFIEPGNTVFDIGANIGYYSLIASLKAQHGSIYAFEPYQNHYNELLLNSSLNQLNNIKALNVAVSNSKQKLQLFVSAEDNTGMTGLAQPENFSGHTEVVNAISLDEWIKEGQLKKPDIIKMDIEGGEWIALQGMQMILRDVKPVVFIEIASSLLSKFGKQASDIYNFMNEFGYQAYEVVEQNKLKLITDFRDGDLIIFIPAGYKIPAAIEIEQTS